MSEKKNLQYTTSLPTTLCPSFISEDWLDTIRDGLRSTIDMDGSKVSLAIDFRNESVPESHSA
jgi:hypothetical protein